MLFLGSEETKRMIDIIRGGSAANNAEVLEAVLDIGRRWKPPGFDTEVSIRRDYYNGKQVPHLKKRLRDMFPATHSKIPPVALNFVRLYCETGAAVFDYPPEFWVEWEEATPTDEGGEIVESVRIDEMDPVAALFADVIESCALVPFLAMVERKTIAAGNALVRVGWDAVSKTVALSHFWPNDVMIAVHPSRPESLSHAFALAARIASPNGVASGQGEVWEVWRREFSEDENGSPIFGPWMVSHITSGGDSSKMGADIAMESELGDGETLPWAIARIELPSGSPWVDTDGDVIAIQDAINISQSNEQYISAMQAHTEKVYSGNDTEQKVGGPGKIMQIAAGESLTTLDYNPKLDALQRGRSQLIQHFGRTKRQSPDAYTAENGNVLSGVSRMIANEPQEKARIEAVAMARPFVDNLLGLVVAVHDHHADTKIGDAVKAAWKPAQRPGFEDPAAKQGRIHADMAKGLISKARAVVELGYFETEADAVDAGHSDQVGGSVAQEMAAPARPTLRQRLQAKAPPAQAAEDNG